MPAYDGQRFSPPAAVANVSVMSPDSRATQTERKSTEVGSQARSTSFPPDTEDFVTARTFTCP